MDNATLANEQAEGLRRQLGGDTQLMFDVDVGELRIYWGRSQTHRIRRATVRSIQRAALRRWRAKQ